MIYQVHTMIVVSLKPEVYPALFSLNVSVFIILLVRTFHNKVKISHSFSSLLAKFLSEQTGIMTSWC